MNEETSTLEAITAAVLGIVVLAGTIYAAYRALGAWGAVMAAGLLWHLTPRGECEAE
jgi:hypothetical protein